MHSFSPFKIAIFHLGSSSLDMNVIPASFFLHRTDCDRSRPIPFYYFITPAVYPVFLHTEIAFHQPSVKTRLSSIVGPPGVRY